MWSLWSALSPSVPLLSGIPHNPCRPGLRLSIGGYFGQWAPKSTCPLCLQEQLQVAFYISGNNDRCPIFMLQRSHAAIDLITSPLKQDGFSGTLVPAKRPPFMTEWAPAASADEFSGIFPTSNDKAILLRHIPCMRPRFVIWGTPTRRWYAVVQMIRPTQLHASTPRRSGPALPLRWLHCPRPVHNWEIALCILCVENTWLTMRYVTIHITPDLTGRQPCFPSRSYGCPRSQRPRESLQALGYFLIFSISWSLSSLSGYGS